MTLIIAEPPLVVLPTLATRIGLPEALFIQQLHYHLQNRGREVDGTRWFYRSVSQWVAKDFPFFSTSTVTRTIKSLEERGMITSRVMNKQARDRTKWYTIDYKHNLLSIAQSDQMDLVNVSKPLQKSTSSLQKKSVFDASILPALADVWTKQMGGAFTYPKAAGLLKPIASMLNADGSEVAAQALSKYIASSDDKKYVSIARFAQTYRTWVPKKKPKSEDKKQEALS